MIPDRQFKELLHCSKAYGNHLNGQELEPGYKPDFVLKNGNDFIILESENSSSRKTFVGGMMKAAHFLQGDKQGKLVFVLVPKKNTTAKAIAKHLMPYFKWIKDKTNLTEVYVIEARQYYNNDCVMDLLGDDFNTVALKVS